MGGTVQLWISRDGELLRKNGHAGWLTWLVGSVGWLVLWLVQFPATRKAENRQFFLEKLDEQNVKMTGGKKSQN